VHSSRYVLATRCVSKKNKDGMRNGLQELDGLQEADGLRAAVCKKQIVCKQQWVYI